MRKTDYNECLEASNNSVCSANKGEAGKKGNKPLKIIGSYCGDGFAMPPVVISK